MARLFGGFPEPVLQRHEGRIWAPRPLANCQRGTLLTKPYHLAQTTPTLGGGLTGTGRKHGGLGAEPNTDRARADTSGD